MLKIRLNLRFLVDIQKLILRISSKNQAPSERALLPIRTAADRAFPSSAAQKRIIRGVAEWRLDLVESRIRKRRAVSGAQPC
jgi:hypothetical protein